MQTFLPYPSFVESAKCLDNKRLGKQRVEAYQILKTLLKGPITNGKKTPWYNHPVVKMWKGYEFQLLVYAQTICREWRRRGFNDTVLDKLVQINQVELPEITPAWLGTDKFHKSHRSNLLRKELNWYRQFKWKESDNLPYFWPTKEGY